MELVQQELKISDTVLHRLGGMLSLSLSQLIAENTFPHNNKLHNNNAICDDDDNIDFNTEML